MVRNLFAGLTLALLLLVPADTAVAKGSGSSGSRGFSSGKSYSSGSHSAPSGSRGSSSGGSSSRGFSSGKSYSSGSHSTSPGSSSFSPGGSSARGFSSGKSYSSGSSSPKPSGNSGSRGFSSGATGRPAGSSDGFSSGGRPSSASSPPKGTIIPSFDSRSNPNAATAPRPASKPPFSSGRSYSSGGGTPTSFPSGKSYSSTPSKPADFGTRPSHANYDSSAAALKQREASRAAYTAGQAPRPTYTDQVGRSQPVNPESPVVRQLRRDLDYERWRNREQRERQYYGNAWNGWYTSRPVYTYRDPFSNLFWYWLLSQSFQTQSQWAYNHRDMMDEARYRDLLARDARIEQEIRNLEQQNVPRDPTRVPQSIEGKPVPPDLMYNDDYVQAVYNPQPQATAPSGGGFWHGMFRCLLIVAIILGLMWLVFFKRWGGNKSLGRW